MLKKLRKKKTARMIWIVLIILIVPAFVFWGFGSFMRGKEESYYLGAVLGKKITPAEYKEAATAVRNQAIIQFGDNFEEIEKNINLEQQAWERLLLLAEAKRRKLTESDSEVIGLIRAYPFFQRKGKFDDQIYSQMLTYVFHTQPRVFEEQVRQNLIISKLYKALTEGVSLSEETIAQEYKKVNEEMNLYYIAGISSDFANNIAATDEEIKDYFAKNSLQFKEPTSFNVEYVSLGQEEKDEQALKDKINKLVLRLNKKEGFQNAAKEMGLELKETGFFSEAGPIPGIGWSPQILSLVSKLKAQEFSPVIRMDKHYYILRLKEKRQPYTPDLQMIKDKVRERFIKEKSQEAAKGKALECLEKLKEMSGGMAKAVDFDSAARTYGLKSGTTGLFRYGSYIERIGLSDNFFAEASQLKPEEFSGIIEMPSGYYIVKLKTKVTVDEKKFEQEKNVFAERLLAQKKIEYFTKFLEQLKTKIQLF